MVNALDTFVLQAGRNRTIAYVFAFGSPDHVELFRRIEFSAIHNVVCIKRARVCPKRFIPQ